jgi:hypothetical protein
LHSYAFCNLMARTKNLSRFHKFAPRKLLATIKCSTHLKQGGVIPERKRKRGHGWTHRKQTRRS